MCSVLLKRQFRFVSSFGVFDYSVAFKNTLLKVIGCALVFYWESTFYRSYYIIMAAMTIFMYLIFVWLRQREKSNENI